MMNIVGRKARKYAAGLGIIGLCALGASAEEASPDASPVMNETSTSIKTPETTIQNWPERSRTTARALIVKYGAPSRFDDDNLVWYKNGPWSKTVVYRKAPEGLMHGKDVLEQSIAYDVPDDKLPELKSFDSRIKFDKTSGELISSAENEKLNFLALNLADEIVTGKRNADEARDFYRKTSKLSESGKSSAYMDGFVFQVSEMKASTQTLSGQESTTAEPNPAESPDVSAMPHPVEPANVNPNPVVPNP